MRLDERQRAVALHTRTSHGVSRSGILGVLVLAGLPLAGVAGCAPNLSTQPRRQDYLKDHVNDNVQKTFNCESTVLRFQRTEQRSGDWYDYYVAEGCGQRSDYVTQVSQTNEGRSITWAFGAFPTEAQYSAAAEQQLLKTARFDLTCEGPVDVATLKSAIDPMHSGYRATVGAKGCGKQTSYEVSCGHAGYVGGKHEITCTSVASAPAAKP